MLLFYLSTSGFKSRCLPLIGYGFLPTVIYTVIGHFWAAMRHGLEYLPRKIPLANLASGFLNRLSLKCYRVAGCILLLRKMRSVLTPNGRSTNAPAITVLGSGTEVVGVGVLVSP